MTTEWIKDQYRVSTDKTELQLEVIHAFLKTSYWAENIPKNIIEKSIEGSLCFGLYINYNTQIGFARLVTDCATFAYLMDVFVLEKYRGIGLGKWLVRCIMKYSGVSEIRRFLLGTVNAHGLYAKSGFRPIAKPELLMEINTANPYKEFS